MPTHNRRQFVPLAIGYFQRQDYPHKELIIVDDGTDPVDDLVPRHDERVRYIRLPSRMTVGAKRNLACEHARGAIIAHWDDDDWHAPHRLTYQVRGLLQAGADMCGITTLLFYDAGHDQAWQYTYPDSDRPWLAGSSLCYTRAFWSTNQFADINVAEDARFVWAGRPERMLVLPDHTFHVGMIHPQNVSSKRTDEPYWRSHPVSQIQHLLGSDWRAYQAPPPTPLPGHTRAHERDIPPLTVAHMDDLNLPEFAAFNYRQDLPWMRRWELPFALFQAHLPNTGAILDCTINPATFQERLSRLYPHVLYRHFSPIQAGQFVLPLVPDQAFDRAVCVNTLEHLLHPQREALIATLARALKPGGLLVLTSDYYFDSAWEQAAFLDSGVMRADRADVFNGWNKIRPRDWLELCRPCGLEPTAALMDEPREDDWSVYRNPPPYPHTCIGGVFAKPPVPTTSRRRVVLSLLIWNTRSVSLQSARAHLREARLLERLGYEPLLCICDNGSTDGTPAALQAFEPEIDVPHTFIFNERNLGNSIARNQIIDVMLQRGADYLLMTDGDVELVPFSSFAMLRHMENSGSRLGCVGADHWGQSPHPEQVTPFLYSLQDCGIESTDLIAFTQYGMFRRAVFEDGVRFEEGGPFAGPGWGYEDNDLAFQMQARGYVIQSFSGVTYLHRDARSSVRIMREQGIDAARICAQRQQYVVHKWADVSPINSGPLMIVRDIQIGL
jgi:glycosyltransferase involved in cell wall biosynthesis